MATTLICCCRLEQLTDTFSFSVTMASRSGGQELGPKQKNKKQTLGIGTLGRARE